MDETQELSKQWKVLTKDKSSESGESSRSQVLRTVRVVDPEEEPDQATMAMIKSMATSIDWALCDSEQEDEQPQPEDKPKLTEEEQQQKQAEKERKAEERKAFLETVAGRLGVFLRKVGKIIADSQKQLNVITTRKNKKLLPTTITKEYLSLFKQNIAELKESRSKLEDLKGKHQDLKVINREGKTPVGGAEKVLDSSTIDIKAFKKVIAVYLVESGDEEDE